VLAAVVPRLSCPLCGEDAPLDSVPFTQGDGGRIHDGILVCAGCRTWFPIQDDLLELVEPDLLDSDALKTFEARFGSRLPAGVAAPADVGNVDTPQMRQRRHFDWFASDETLSYDAYQRSRFWRAVDAAAFASWTQMVHSGSWILDVGCANGRSAWPFLETGVTLVGCDISRRLIAQAIEHARKRGLSASTTFLVADADRLPFRSASFDAVVTYGALHHLPNPGRTCVDIQRIIKAGGIHFGSENNKSALRGVFDLLMKINPLWIEEAGKEPLISEGMIREWLSGTSADVTVETTVFAPPHLINVMPEGWGASLLHITDAIGGRVPGLRRNGGLIVFTARKPPAHAVN
jgi:ubiquinone/menaquinone biosynthesis C-methylase UbiE/uncharacterized protein YbaR (Trm112 family)